MRLVLSAGRWLGSPEPHDIRGFAAAHRGVQGEALLRYYQNELVLVKIPHQKKFDTQCRNIEVSKYAGLEVLENMRAETPLCPPLALFAPPTTYGYVREST